MNPVVQVYDGDGVNPRWVDYQWGDGAGSSGCDSGVFLHGTGVGDGGKESTNSLLQSEEEDSSGVDSCRVGDEGYGDGGHGGGGLNMDFRSPMCNIGDQDPDA